MIRIWDLRRRILFLVTWYQIKRNDDKGNTNKKDCCMILLNFFLTELKID